MPTQGLLDTSVVVDHDLIDPAMLPDESESRSDAGRTGGGASRHR